MVPIKVVIADDHALFRDGLKKILSLEKDILVVGEAANGDEITRVIDRTKPDILLLDLKMPKEILCKICLTLPLAVPRPGLSFLPRFRTKKTFSTQPKGERKDTFPRVFRQLRSCKR